MSADVAVTARHATAEDLDVLVDLYRGLEDEQTVLKDMWPLADGLAEPVTDSVEALLNAPDAVTIIGELEGCPFGFAVAMVIDLLPQAEGLQVGSVRLIYTDPPARGVGVGEAMIGFLLDQLRERGLRRFDAHVLPGHRQAKNFFEASGFAARSIVMHHNDG